MIWEALVIAALAVLAAIHSYFDKMYSNRIRQFDADILEETSNSDLDEDDVESITEYVRVSAQANVDRTNNRYVVLVHIVCMAGLSVMLALEYAGLTTKIGLASAVILILPILLLAYHVRNVFVLPARWRRRSLRNVS